MIIIITISLLIGFIFAILGCFVLWKRYVYFGDGLAHTSMFASIISVILGLPIFYTGLFTSILFAFIISSLHSNSGNSAAVGFTTSIMISFSLLLTHLYPNKTSFTRYLVGDIISADIQDLKVLVFIFTVVLILFFFLYKDLILIILSKQIAASKGVKVQFLELIFLIVLSFAILSTIRIVGALLVNSIMIIPAMIARLVSRSPISMITFSVIFSSIMNLTGALSSFYWDIPFALSIILSGGILYFIIKIIKHLKYFFRKV